VDRLVHIALPKVVVLEVEVATTRLRKFIQLAEAVHIELPNERIEFVVAEEVRKHRAL